MIQISDLERSLQQVAATGQVAAAAPTTQVENAAMETENTASELKMQHHTDRVEISAQAYAKVAQGVADQGTAIKSTAVQSTPAQSSSAKRAPVGQPQPAAQAEETQELSTATEAATATPTAEKQALDSAKRTIEQLSSEEESGTTDASEQASSSGTTVLTSLSVQQLEDLVSAGTITRAEADSEMARRQKQIPEEQPTNDVQSMASVQAMED